MAFSDAAASVRLSVQRRQPYVTARQLLEVRIEPGVMKCAATFFYNVRYSGVKSLRIDLPAELASRVRNQTKELRESALEEADGYVGWVLVGEAELLGDTQLKLIWETPIEDLGLGKSVDLNVPRLVPREVDRAEGQIVLVKSETIDVQPKGTPEGLDPIDPEHDLIGDVRVSDAAAALEFQDAWNLTLTATRYQLQMLKQTSIEQALLRLVITRSDRVAVQALYRMRSNQQRLQIQLPEEVALGSIELDTDPLRINGRRVSLERGDDNRSFFVPLVGITPNEPFLLEMRYTTSGSGKHLTYPYFPDEPATQKVNLVAYLPQERSFLGKVGPWTDELKWVQQGPMKVQQPVPRVSVDQLLKRLTQDIELPRNPAEDFPVDGRPLLFSTLRPPAPDPAPEPGGPEIRRLTAQHHFHARVARADVWPGRPGRCLAAATTDHPTDHRGLRAAGRYFAAGRFSADLRPRRSQPDPAAGCAAGPAVVVCRVPRAEPPQAGRAENTLAAAQVCRAGFRLRPRRFPTIGNPTGSC